MFVRNQWYVIAWAREITSEPFARMVCGEPILVYRLADGNITAMRDACPHRLLPLSMGIKEGDNIRCRYHGLMLDPEGRVVEMPIKDDKPNQSICAQKYPVVERHAYIWVWIGDSDAANPDLIPNYWMCGSPDWAFDGDSFHVACNYQLLIDNLMDLTHETYVHTGSIGQVELMHAPIETRTEGDRVIVERWIADVAPPPAWKASSGIEGNVDRWQVCHFVPPSGVIIDVGVAPIEEERTLADHPVRSFVVDSITPESETTSWYFWGASRNFAIDDTERTAKTKAVQAKVFQEDVEILEAQQASILANPDMKLRAFNIDAGGVRSRLVLKRLAKQSNVDPV